MNKNITLIVFFILVAGSIAAFIYFKKNYSPKYNWNDCYARNSAQPFGLKLFYSVIKDREAKTTILYNEAYDVLDTNEHNSNFISIGNEFAPDSLEALHILKYVEKGNRLFIATNYSPLEVVRNFVPVTDSIFGYKDQRDSVITVSFENDSLPFPGKINFHYQYIKDTMAYYWSVYHNRYFNDTLSSYSFVPLSFLNDSNINAFYIPHGKGRIIIHTNPVLFTNFYMIRENGFKHANNFLSQLHQGPTYWDDPSTYSSNNMNAPRSNPLKFLFSHPYLKWAWYLFLGTILLYLVFRSKREQRIIPLMPVNTNASIEYTRAIGTLYFQNKGHSHIAGEMYTIFLSDVRARYNIFTDIAEAELIDQLAARSEMNKNVLYNLFKQFKFVRLDPEAKSDDLISLYNAIENYHKKRK